MDSDEEYELERSRPKSTTDRIIDEALDEIKARKKAKKEGREYVATKKKEGKTLAEIEEEEGGTIKESLVGMAQVKRAQNRKAGDKAVQDTEIPTHVEKYEEEAEVVEEDGIKFTGFNLAEERETGYFDEEGNYVERKADDPTQKDAWMNSDEAKVVSEEVRKKIAERQAAEAAAEAERHVPLTDRQIAAMKLELASHMQANETLAKAMKRLGTNQQAQRAMGKREREKLTKQQQLAGGAAANNSQILTRMTEIADRLVGDGEVDVFTETKEQFERFAAMWMPKTAPASTPSAAAQQPSSQNATAGNDDDDDMFASDDEKPEAAKKQETQSQQPDSKPQHAQPTENRQHPSQPGTASNGHQPAQQQQQQPSSVNNDTGQQGDGVDYASWPVKELRRFLQERGVDASTFVEKSGMVAKVKELAETGPTTGSNSNPTSYPPPIGYAFDPSSGYFYNAEAGMYFDGNSGCYYSNGTWYTLDPSTGQFVQMQA